MCTVSFIPAPGKVFITSNRDESAQRPLALPPLRQEMGNYSFVGPKDAQAGGTWIALRNDGSVLVLLNGAFEKHQPQPVYRKSRGQIFWEVFAATHSPDGFDDNDLEGIEPFTMVLWQNGELQEMYWDGERKTRVREDALKPHIWSSCTLYTPKDRIYRKNFFEQWWTAQKKYTAAAIRGFHLYMDPEGREEKNIRINRKGKMLTVSVSCIEIGQKRSIFHYADLVQDKNYRLSL